MSFIDEIQSGNYELDIPYAKKKKKKDEELSPFVKEILAENYSIKMPKGITVKEVEEIAPIKKEKERTWFKGGSFSDGYQFGDATKTILGTAGDVGVGAVKGVGNLAEGLVDLGAYGVAGVGSLFGADTSGIKDFAKKQYVNDWLEPASEFVDRGSLLGDKADAIPEALGYVGGIIGTAGLGGLAGLGATGTTVLTTGTIGASAMGSGMGEAYRGGATDGEAVTYGLISGVAEAGTELIFGGLGKTFKVAGLSHGLSSADDMLAKKISSKISNQVAKNFAELGVKAAAEGSEEVMAGIVQSIGKKVTYMDEEELTQIIEDENLFEQFITGAVTSGLAQSGYIPGMTEGSIREANKTGRDFITGFTTNEQTVLDKVAEKKIAETEKDGTKLTSKEKNKIIEEVQEDLQKGLVDTTDIESILGGETYARLQNTKTEIEDIQKQVAELENKPNAEITVKEREQLDSLREQLKTIDTTSIETQLQTEMKSKIGKDNFLQRSYYEKAQRSKAFVQEVTEKTSDIAKAVYGSAARVMNNTTRSHEFVETVTKIAEDRGTKYIITNNEQLKKLGYYKNVEGATINGLVNKKGEVLINIDSKNALNKIVGHETTHLLEGTNEYKVFQDTVKEYATTKGEYEARRQALTKLYEGTKADIEAELTSDLVGDYLFNDEKFVNHLSTKQPNVFKKVYDYIKHLVKQVTAGSKEARQLEKVRYRFEQAYRSVQKDGQNRTDTKYSLTDNKGRTLAKEQEEYFKDSKVRDENGNLKVMYHGTSNYGFTIFDYGSTKFGLFGQGFYFTDSQEVAQSYTEKGKGQNKGVYETYLNIKNPMDMDALADVKWDNVKLDGEPVANYLDVSKENATNEDYFKALKNYAEEMEMPRWEAHEFIAETIENMGYDGLTHVGGGRFNSNDTNSHRVYVAFESNQIKNVDNLNPTDNPDIRYSLSEEGKLVDDKGNDVTLEASNTGNHNSLMAIHNLSEAKLKGILELGGFPVPSIAIIDTDKTAHDDYGEISVLFDKETIDPANKENLAYASDVYSPRFPQTVNELNMSGVKQVADILAMSPSQFESNYENMPIEQVVDRLLRNEQVIDKYLESKNITVEPIYIQFSPEKSGVSAHHIESFLNNHEEFKNGDIVLRDIDYDKYNDEIKQIHIESLVEAGATIEDAESLYQDFGQADSIKFLMDVRDYKRIQNSGQEIDEYATKSAKERKIDIYSEEYKAFVRDLISPAFGGKYIRNNTELFTPSGNRRSFKQLHDVYNLDNVVKRIKGKVRGEEGFFYGAGNIRSQITPQFKSIAEIKANKDKLVSNSQMEEIKKDINSELNNLSVVARNFGGFDYDSYELALNEIAGLKEITSNVTRKTLEEYGFKNVPDILVEKSIEFLEKLKNAPTEYFEVKPQRAVGFDEVQALVVPNSIGTELKQQLNDAGINVIEYDPNIEGDRQAKINQFDDLKFSLSNQDDIAPRQRGQTYSEDVKIQEVIGEVEQTINNLFDRINNIYDRVTVDEEDYAPVNEASLPGLEQQYEESFNAIGDNIAPMVFEHNPVVEGSQRDTKNVTIDDKVLRDDMLNLGTFNAAKTLNSKELKEAATELNTLISEGLDDAKLDTFVESLGTRLLVEHDPYKYDDTVKRARDYVRKTKLFVGETTKKGIGQWNEFRKANMGKMKLTNDTKATPVDVAYMELQEMFGTSLFPEDIYNPADQLIHISETLGDAKGQMTLYNYAINEYGHEAWENLKQTFIDGIKTKVSEIAKRLEGQNYTNYYSSIPMAEDIQQDYYASTPMAEKEESIAIEPAPVPPTKEPKMIRVNPESEEMQKVAQILEEEPKTENDRNKRKWAIFKANVFDKGAVFEDVSLKHKNRKLMGKWDYTLTSEARGQNAIGQGHYEYDPISKTIRQVSKSLNDIRAEVENSGLATEFYEYIYHKHNIDRMSLEAKAHERIRATLRTSEYSHEELMKLANKRITEKTSPEDVMAIEKAREYKALYEIKNKPVFGNSVTAKDSQEIVNEYELAHPEFMDFAQDIYNYTNADRQELVNNGVISQETADLWQQMYPHYVPIRRAGYEGAAINVPLDTGRTGVNAPIKKATGGNKDILPLFDTMALRTLQTYRATAKNSFGVELMNTIGTKINSQNTTVDEVLDSVDTQEELLQEGKKGQKPTFTVFEDGVKHTFEITKDMYDALKPVSDSSLLSKTFAVPNKISSFHRGVLTEYNPVFMLTNAIKDSQDIMINSQHPARTYSKVGEAFAQLVKKGYWYQEYMANGGEQNSYFDSQDNTFKTENKGLSKILDIPPLSTISKLNNYIEKVPRLAEYIASREMGRSVEVSMLDAARVTTNFKAGGNLTKFANRNGATFLNASVQGLVQQVRNVREAKSNGAKGWMNLATKFAIAGLPAVLLNALVWDDDEEYEELSDYIKQNYYIVGKTDDGKFIRIPKGRTLAVIQEAIQQISDVATGDDEADLKAFIDLALTNLAPNNPVQDNILSPIVQVATNTTWYGEDLVPTRLQDLPAAEQFDESTDAFSKWLGEKTNVSPVKINYLLDQYTGGVGDVVLPMMTPKAESGAETTGEKLLAPLNNKFTADAVLNNQNVADFYDKSDELTTEAKKSNATDEDILRNKYLNSVKAEMNELYKEKREVQNSSLGNKEKYNKVRSIQTEINKLAKEGLGSYNDVEMKSNYSTVGDREYYKTTKGEWEKVEDKEKAALNNLGMTANTKNRYFKARNEISEIKNSDAENKKTPIIKAIREANLNDEQTAYLYDKHYASTEKLDVVLKTGIGMDAYLDLELQGFTADKDDEGKTISGSKKDKIFEYINTLDIGFEQRVILAKMYYPTYDEYNYDIIEYLNNDDSISYEDMVKILNTLKFEVDDEGNVWWD